MASLDSEKFKEYMQKPLLTFTCSAKPNLIITRDKETISVEAKSTLKTDKIKFKLNEDNSVIKSCARSTLISHHISTSRWDGKSTTLERVTENGKLEVKCIMGEVVATRIYEKEA
uniref:Lipocalin/cytosolic fatty-acid binding domain-containing protein n=1 Tax=Poecilia reticulata TaxID=8081 RepID=A0A3P9Q311_POERE